MYSTRRALEREFNFVERFSVVQSRMRTTTDLTRSDVIWHSTQHYIEIYEAASISMT